MKNIVKNINIFTNPYIIKKLPTIFITRIRKKVYQKIYSKLQAKSLIIERKLKVYSSGESDSFLSIWPDASDRITGKADLFLNNKFTFLGTDFNFNNQISWNYDPKDKLEWELKKYDERNIHYPDSPKDVKIVWEFNRHQYLFTLAKSFIITKDEKYSNCIINHLQSWIEQNPVGMSVNCTSPMEISIRLISWIFALDLISESKIYKENEQNIFKSISEHILFLRYHLSDDRLIHTNHLIGELTGLIVAGMVFDFKDNVKIRKQALSDLVRELKGQVFNDGVSKEQSSSYHRFVIDFLTLIVVISDKAKVDIPVEIKATLEKMINYINAVITPDGGSPMIGDADNGRGFMLAEQADFWNSEHVLSNGVILFKNGNFKKNSNLFNEESYWLFGEKGKSIYDSVKENISDERHYCFSNAGHYVVKNNKSGFYFFVRGGEFGMGGSYFSSHSHFDLLSPVIYFRGKPFLIDSGTFVYNGDKENRNKFRISEAHNNITWNDSVAIPKLNFGWEKVCNALLAEHNKTDIADKLNFKLKKVAGYKREFTVKNNSVMICDSFRKGYYDLNWNFHFHPDCNIQQKDGNSFIINNMDVQVVFKSNVKGLSNIESEVSFNYGEKTNNLCLHMKKSVVDGDAIEFSIEAI